MFLNTSIPQATLENHYLYKVKQTLFNKGKEETVDISCIVAIRCDAGKILLMYITNLSQKRTVFKILLLRLHYIISLVNLYNNQNCHICIGWEHGVSVEHEVSAE